MTNLGNVAFQKDDHPTAAEWWTKVLAIDPSHEHASRGVQFIEQLKNEE